MTVKCLANSVWNFRARALPRKPIAPLTMSRVGPEPTLSYAMRVPSLLVTNSVMWTSPGLFPAARLERQLLLAQDGEVVEALAPAVGRAVGRGSLGDAGLHDRDLRAA